MAPQSRTSASPTTGPTASSSTPWWCGGVWPKSRLTISPGGRLAYVSGCLKGRGWTGTDGIGRRALEIIADDIGFLSPKGRWSAARGGGKAWAGSRESSRPLPKASPAGYECPRLRVGGLNITALELLPTVPVGFPSWIEPDLRQDNGLDPMGFDTISTDRIMPTLLPAWVGNTQRPRYLSFYLMILDEFHRRGLGHTQHDLNEFIRHSEFELGTAVLRHATGNHCGREADAVIGTQRVRRALRGDPSTIPREVSVRASASGGYGQLGYRNVLRDLGLTARVGEIVDGAPLAYDRLARDRARAVAQLYRSAVEDTVWFTSLMGGDTPLPVAQLDALTARGCLCQLRDNTEERDALFNAITTAEGDDATEAEYTQRRRRAIALALLAIQTKSEAASDPASLRQTIWKLFLTTTPESATPELRAALSSWGALAAKEYYAALVGVAWAAVNHLGRSTVDASWEEDDFLAVIGRAANTQSSALAQPLPDGPRRLSGLVHDVVDRVASLDMETIIARAMEETTVVAALGGLLSLRARLPKDPDADFSEIAAQQTWAQLGLFDAIRRLGDRLAADSELGETASWLVRQFVLIPHEALATLKLSWYEPPMHSFRFRHERGRLRFFQGVDGELRRIGAPRFSALQRLCRDIGLWTPTADGGSLTAAGSSFVAEVFG